MRETWTHQLVSVELQLDNFRRGMKWKCCDVDRTDHHINVLKRMQANLEKLLDHCC